MAGSISEDCREKRVCVYSFRGAVSSRERAGRKRERQKGKLERERGGRETVAFIVQELLLASSLELDNERITSLAFQVLKVLLHVTDR